MARLIAGSWAVWIVGGILPALFFSRFLYGDGAFYLMQILEKHAFFYPTDVRQSVQVLTQWPGVLAVFLGITNLKVVTWCFGSGILFMPAIFHGVSLVILLRRGWTVQAAVYLIMVWLLMFFGGLMAVSESHMATAVFLLAVVLALNESPYRMSHWITLGLIALISFRLYEFWVFYSAGLVVLLILKLKPQFRAMRGYERFAGLSVLTVFLASLIVNAMRLLRLSGNEDAVGLLRMLSGSTYPVYLALISAWFLGLCAHVWLLSSRQDSRIVNFFPSERSRIWALFLSLLALMTIVLSVYQHHTMIRYSYPFRTLNLILPMVYLAWMIACARSCKRISLFPGCRTLVVILTLFLLIQESWLTLGWQRYQDWVGEVPRQNSEFHYVAKLPDTALARTWTYPWTQSSQSFLAQALRFGTVKGISYDPRAPWEPYIPRRAGLFQSIAKAYGIKWE